MTDIRCDILIYHLILFLNLLFLFLSIYNLRFLLSDVFRGSRLIWLCLRKFLFITQHVNFLRWIFELFFLMLFDRRLFFEIKKPLFFSLAANFFLKCLSPFRLFFLLIVVFFRFLLLRAILLVTGLRLLY
jgi:hypothetical protein